MKRGANSANIVGFLSSVILGVVVSVSAPAYAESAVEVSGLTLALNSENKSWNTPTLNNIVINDLASKASTEALNKAMEKVNSKLEKQLEDEITRKMDYATH